MHLHCFATLANLPSKLILSRATLCKNRRLLSHLQPFNPTSNRTSRGILKFMSASIARPSTPPPPPPPPTQAGDSSGSATGIKTTHIAPSPSPSTHSPLPKRAKPTYPSNSNPPAFTPGPSLPFPNPNHTMLSSSSSSFSSSPPPLLIKLLTAHAQPPKRGSALAAGYDIFASEALTIAARGKGLVSTGISMAIPSDCYGRIAPRSGLASKSHIDTGAGVIDADYRGEVKVLLFNHAETDFVVARGDRVAQLILERIYTPEISVVETLEESVRGAGGFGSTGVGAEETSAKDPGKV